MRQIFSVRFFAAVGGVVGLFFLLTTIFATRQVIEGGDDGPPPIELHKIDFVDEIAASTNPQFSLTIEGVRVVVDAGLERVPRFSPRTGMTRLETRRITRASADQRRGRAGADVDPVRGHAAAVAVRGESRTRAKARDFSSDQGAEPQEYREYFKVRQRGAGGKDPLSARRDFHHGLLMREGV